MQKLGGNAMLVDAEHAFDPAYSKALGVDVENLIVCQPDNGEMALESNNFSLFTPLEMIFQFFVLATLSIIMVVLLEFVLSTKLLSISVADRMCRSGAVDLICIDSVSALTPRAEIEVSQHFNFLN